jgi:hypothetical protein
MIVIRACSGSAAALRAWQSKSRAKSIDGGLDPAHLFVPTTQPSILMPLRRELLEEMARAREASELEAERIRLHDMIRTGAFCVMWMLIGLYLLGWSMHTTDDRYARLAFYGGVIVGNAGIVFTLLRAYHRGEQRGDW